MFEEGEGVFGLQSSPQSKLQLLPVPFEATTSYRSGTVDGPQNIFEASFQVDLFHELYPDNLKSGVHWRLPQAPIREWNDKAKAMAHKAREEHDRPSQDSANEISNQLNDFVYQECKSLLDKNHRVGLVGGDHAVPFGAIKATLQKFPKAGILHFDAHFDLREAYQGFEHSHASIMYNVVTQLKPAKLVQVGIRDFCKEEYDFSKQNQTIKVFSDRQIFDWKARGEAWKEISSKIIESLPSEVYVSFDIDGLDPVYCPGTGTPVPGGLSFQEAIYLLRMIPETGRKLIGFDLVEVGAEEYDGIVGARMLFELSVLSLIEG